MDLKTLQAVYMELTTEYKTCREMLENAILNQDPEEKQNRWATICSQARTSRQIVAKMIEKELGIYNELLETIDKTLSKS